jgi:hypothetical protein
MMSQMFIKNKLKHEFWSTIYDYMDLKNQVGGVQKLWPNFRIKN